MTVGELIKRLSELPSGAIVLVQASAPEMGYTHLTVQRRSVQPAKPEGYWDGEFHDHGDELAVVLERHHKMLP